MQIIIKITRKYEKYNKCLVSSTVYQMCAHFTKCICIWPLLVSLTKCAAHLGKCAAQLAKCVRIWPNIAHLAKRCAFGQMSRVSSIGQMCSAFGQMRRLVKCALHYHQKYHCINYISNIYA